MWDNCGTEQSIVPLAGVDHVHACRPVPALLAKYSVNALGQAKAYVFARTAEGFESRYFWMPDSSSVSEDPGTGSACANLGGWWLATQGATPLDARVTQGTAIERPNLLALTVREGRIRVGGRVIELGAGELRW
jgi:predicted PhzF superfamily epimerase YddE/YHI9